MGSESTGSSPSTPVVTLFGTYGAGVHEVGRRVADALGLPYHQQAFSSQTLAGSGEADPAERAVLARVVDVLGRAHAPAGTEDLATTERMIHELVVENDRRVSAAAERGGVIVGRNGPVVLAGRPATVHVLLTGQVGDRIARAAQDFGITPAEARRVVMVDLRVAPYHLDDQGVRWVEVTIASRPRRRRSASCSSTWVPTGHRST